MRPLFIFLMLLLGLPPAFGVELVGVPTIASSASNVVVHWTTDVACGTRIQVSPTATIKADKAADTQHTATLAGLQPGVTYTVVVGSARVRLATNVFTTTGTATTAAPVESQKDSAAKIISSPKISAATKAAPPPRKIWGNPESLPDHFARHGGDFHAKDADDYARMSWNFSSAPRPTACRPRWTRTVCCACSIRRAARSPPTIATARPRLFSSPAVTVILSGSRDAR